MSRGCGTKHKIRHLQTNTGDNFFITISREASAKFSGCCLHETVTSDGILLTLGSRPIVKSVPSHLKNFTEI